MVLSDIVNKEIASIVERGPNTKLIRQSRQAARKEDERGHSGQYAYHARETIEGFISSYSSRWNLLNETVGAINSGRECIDNQTATGLIRGFRFSEDWLSTYRKKGSILAVLGTEGYQDFAMLAREGLVIVTGVSERFYQMHQS